MSLHPKISSPRRVLAAAALLLSAGAMCLSIASAAEAQTAGRKEMRDARTAVREGRLAEGLEDYERILKHAEIDKQRFEALYNTVLIVLSTGSDAAAPEKVEERLERLGALIESGDYDDELEVETLAALLSTIHSLEAKIENLERQLVSDAAAAELAAEAARRAAAEALAVQKARTDAERKDRLLLEQRLDLAERQRAAREEELVTRVEELGQCTEEMQLVLDQLEGTQASEVQMLQVVMRKNEDLAKNRLALQRQKGELAAQAQQLQLKEEEVRKREEAIREVTERVLGKDQPDS